MKFLLLIISFLFIACGEISNPVDLDFSRQIINNRTTISWVTTNDDFERMDELGLKDLEFNIVSNFKLRKITNISLDTLSLLSCYQIDVENSICVNLELLATKDNLVIFSHKIPNYPIKVGYNNFINYNVTTTVNFDITISPTFNGLYNIP